jgi:IgA peptidase M64
MGPVVPCPFALRRADRDPRHNVSPVLAECDGDREGGAESSTLPFTSPGVAWPSGSRNAIRTLDARRSSIRSPPTASPQEPGRRARHPTGGFRDRPRAGGAAALGRRRALAPASKPAPLSKPAPRAEPRPARAAPVTDILRGGDPANRLDIALMGDGYTQAEPGKFAQDAQKLVHALRTKQPFSRYQGYINVHRIDVASSESGADSPRRARRRHRVRSQLRLRGPLRPEDVHAPHR